MKKYIFAICAIALALCLCLGIMADTASDKDIAAPFESGIYTIKNVSNGQNLNAFDIKYSDAGYAYTDEESGEEGENVLLLKQDDGSYLLYPQSEEGKYAYCLSDGKLAKSEEITVASYFEIAESDGGYLIKNKGGQALFVSDETLYKKPLVNSRDVSGDTAEKWELSKVEISSFELKTITKFNKVKLNSVSAVYAVVKPAYMKNFIEWYSSDESVLLIDDDGTFCAVGTGKATVTAMLDGTMKSIEITVVDEEAFTWYSQHLAANGGWYGNELSNVYFQSGGSYKRFIINGYNRGLDWLDEGCFLTSVAMVLRNLGARYEDGYDFRFDADGALEVDPYVAALANSGNRGLASSRGTLYNNPILIRYGQVEKAFTLHGQPIELVQKYSVTKSALKKALDAHPEGVIVGMKNSHNGTHYIVVTECINPEATNPNNYRFMIYDSAGLSASQGNNVPFELSISYVTMRYRYSHMRSMVYFNIVPTEEE